MGASFVEKFKAQYLCVWEEKFRQKSRLLTMTMHLIFSINVPHSLTAKHPLHSTDAWRFYGVHFICVILILLPYPFLLGLLWTRFCTSTSWTIIFHLWKDVFSLNQVVYSVERDKCDKCEIHTTWWEKPKKKKCSTPVSSNSQGRPMFSGHFLYISKHECNTEINLRWLSIKSDKGHSRWKLGTLKHGKKTLQGTLFFSASKVPLFSRFYSH